MPKLAPGATVRVERDETKYPSRGTWPQFRGRTGTLIEVNRAGGGLPEYGVVFGTVTPRTDGRGAYSHSDIVTWFKSYELRVLDGVA